jgi:gas vesicle protein
VTDRTAICSGAMVGALVGAAATYLFFTEAGRSTRDRLEPAIDDLMREFQKFRRTLEKVGDMANDGMRAFNEFQQARQTQFPGGRTSH